MSKTNRSREVSAALERQAAKEIKQYEEWQEQNWLKRGGNSETREVIRLLDVGLVAGKMPRFRRRK